jgi:S1-C subfamily serine protease
LNREEAIINIFEQNTYSVVNIFDNTLTVCACMCVYEHLLHATACRPHSHAETTLHASAVPRASLPVASRRCVVPPQPGATLSADRPEGNGTGIVWDDAGHVVTNYHVLGGALRNYRPGQGQQAQRVARVTLLGAERTCHACRLASQDMTQLGIRPRAANFPRGMYPVLLWNMSSLEPSTTSLHSCQAVHETRILLSSF